MKHFKKFDKFGEKFSFNYNNYDKYSTRVGGFVFLSFIIISISYFILSFIPFSKRKNYSLQFYTIHSSAEKIPINNFIYGIQCEDKNNNIKDYFNLNLKYKKNNSYEDIDIKNCTLKDFNISNNYNISIDKFKCINNENKTIEGIYTDENFSFFKITVESKNNNVEEIDNFLKNNECKLQVYYKDYIFDIENYTNFSKPILNSLFIQLNPDFDVKKNVFFMKYHFKNEDEYIDISLFTNSEKEIPFVGFSRTEDYFIYNTTKPNENENKRYATLFIRADDRKTEINKKYQNLLDFYAENTSIWFGIFEALNIFFTIYNGYNANISMSKKLFFFDEIKEDNKYNTILRTNTSKSNNSKLKNKTINSTANNINEITNINSYYEEKNKDDIKKESNNYEKNIISEKSFSSTEDDNVIQKSKIQIEENKKINKIRLFEIIKISFFSCFECIEKKEKYKDKLIKKAIYIFDKKLDIYIYIKNMILIDIMYQILISDINKDYINFLSRSLIYLDKNIKEQSKELEAIYKPSSKLNYDYSNKLFKKFTKLVEKEEKTEIENKIISLYMKKN